MDTIAVIAPRGAPAGLKLARWIFIGVITVNIIAGSSLWALSAVSTARAATTDLRQRVKAVEASMKLANLLDPSMRAATKANLTAMHADVVALENVAPFENGFHLYHALTMIDDLISVGQHAINAADILTPPLQVFIRSVSHPVDANAAAPPGALTASEITHAVSELKQAQALWQTALAERKSLSQSDLRSLPISNASQYAQKLDAAAPMVNKAFAIALNLAPELHSLLGIQRINRLLLFDMDSDELRPTGGFLGNYALITIYHGVLTSRISLHDVYGLDCPNNNCPFRNLPSEYSWFLAGAGHFGMRDANLDPDLPRSGALIESMFRLEGGPWTNGVIFITPQLIAQVLNVVGSLSIPQFHETITGANLRDRLHYYHQNPQIAQQLGISAAALGTTEFKVFDVLLDRALIAKFSGLSQAQLGKVASLFARSLQSRDLQVYSDVTQVEDALRQLGLAGEVRTAPDSLFVVDTNDRGSYANADVSESYVDHVTLDSHMGAHHTLTITYAYAPSSHSYAIAPDYTDFVRVIVPSAATQGAISGNCAPAPAQEPGHAVLGCRMILPQGQQRALTFTWYTPPPATQAGASPSAQSTYVLLVQRQAGAAISAVVTISPAPGTTILSATAAQVKAGEAVWTAQPFTTDTQLEVRYK